MPEFLRILIIVLALASILFYLAKQPASEIIGQNNFTRRRNLWFGLTFTIFIAPNFWVYTFIAILLLLLTNRYESNKPALFFFILFVVPIATIEIPGIGLINFLFELSHPRILALTILIPAFISISRQGHNFSFNRTWPDKIFTAYLLLTALLYLRDFNITNFFRQIFYLFIDIYLPYVVISHSLKRTHDFKDALLCFLIASILLALIAIFEFIKGWLLYNTLLQQLGLKEGMTNYLQRDRMLRVIVTAGHPIALGYLMVIAIGFFLFMKNTFTKISFRRLCLTLLAAGIFVPLSRGPWIGAYVLLVAFYATGRNPIGHLFKLMLVTTFSLSIISMAPGGERIINLLPFIGSTETGGIEYRQNLITNSLIAIQRNPLLGSNNYLETPEMEAMLQGDHIVDLVNTYIQIALKKGIIGLLLFVSFFALIITNIYRAMRTLPDMDSDEYLLGRVLIATLFAILTIIATVSSVTFIPILYWSIAGMGVAYIKMIKIQSEKNAHNILNV